MSTSFSLTNSTPRIDMIREPLSFAGMPLIPAGRSGSRGSAGLLHRFSTLDWDIGHASATSPGVSQRVVLDLWLSLLASRDEGGHVVVLDRAATLRSPSVTGGVAGTRYRQRLAALDYLTQVRLGPEGLPVISGWAVTNAGGALEVRLDPEFTARYLSGPTVELDPGVLAQLDAGTPRALYRALAWLHAERRGTHRIPAREMIERIGGTRERLQRSRVEQLLDPAHEQLVMAGVLARMPRYRDRDGEVVIDYTVGALAKELTSADVLRTAGLALGVHRDRLSTLLANHQDDLICALAAAALGVVTVRQSLPKMIWTYARWGHEITDSGRRFDLAAPAESQTPHSHERYLIWAAQECEARIADRPELQDLTSRTRSWWRKELSERGGHYPNWVEEGLVRLTLQRLLHLPSLRDYRRAACGGRVPA